MAGKKRVKKYTGIVEASDLEGGQWLLRTKGGDVYQLIGGGPWQAGQEVTVAGDIERDMMSFAMTAPRLRVR